MAYTITTTAGATLASIADGTVNSTATSLTLIGKKNTITSIVLTYKRKASCGTVYRTVCYGC